MTRKQLEIFSIDDMYGCIVVMGAVPCIVLIEIYQIELASQELAKFESKI